MKYFNTLHLPLLALTIISSTTIAVPVAGEVDPDGKAKTKTKDIKIAIIGGGISGSFTAKYLADYDDECLLDITIFDPPSDETAQQSGSSVQGSRVSSLKRDDNSVVELGASIVFDGNKLVLEMIDGDDELVKVAPHSPRPLVEGQVDDAINKGMGIYNGNSDENPWSLVVANMTSDEVRNTLLWRYNLDLWRVNRATNNALSSFDLIYDFLDSTNEHTFFESPNDVWRAAGLSYAASVSFDDYLDKIGVSSSMSWWRSLLSDQGIARSELYTAMNICNNNQINAQMTGKYCLVEI